MSLWHNENEYLSVTINEDLSGDIVDKTRDIRWRMGRVALQEEGQVDAGHVWLRTGRSICEQYPGRFRGEQQGDAVRVTLLGRESREVGQFICRFSLDGPWFNVELQEIDESIPSLVFPPPIESESLVVPRGVGQWIRKPLQERFFWVYPAHLNMRWFGGLRGDNGWLAVLDEGYADSGALATALAISPAWLQSLDQWPGVRRVRYRFAGGGYVGLARAYREYAIEKGLHRSLRDKIAENPLVANLHGGRLLSFMQAMPTHPEKFEERFVPVPPEIGDAQESPRIAVTHAQTAQIISEARELGMGRGFVVVRGWIAGGYDETHPDVWPPEPKLGTIQELKRLLSLNDTLTVALHDNYQDIYQQSASWPCGVNRMKNGDPMPGGLWAGGQAYIINARDGLAYAKRNWEQIKTLEPRSMFIDTTIAVQLYQSWEEGNTLTRGEDEALKIELLRFYKDQGMVLGSEEGADFGVPLVDWIENRHHRVAGQSVPLWPLVFHDATYNLRYGPGPHAPETATSPAPRWLTDMLWGYPLIWGVSAREPWAARRDGFATTLHVDAWHKRIGLDDMVSHRYLDESGELEESVFSSGVALIANFTAESRTVEGVEVPACGYVVRE